MYNTYLGTHNMDEQYMFLYKKMVGKSICVYESVYIHSLIFIC